MPGFSICINAGLEQDYVCSCIAFKVQRSIKVDIGEFFTVSVPSLTIYIWTLSYFDILRLAHPDYNNHYDDKAH